jgi:hypothetical protein
MIDVDLYLLPIKQSTIVYKNINTGRLDILNVSFLRPDITRDIKPGKVYKAKMGYDTTRRVKNIKLKVRRDSKEYRYT